MLILPIKKKWFDMIKSGEKKEEYREIKPYYDTRFRGYYYPTTGMQPHILFRNGYSKNSPTIKCKVCITKGAGKQEWGAEPNKEYYILDILEVHQC
mgnify:CR=1 FL=1|jgi:hypothetical protein